MDESACLVRSFSNPVDVSGEVKEDGKTHDPIHVLTQSISFGRFMSESLAWEKWSTFSHNRYLEEVEKFSKPGSVAQKKAFSEAHYKKRAAMRASVMLEQANNFTSDASQVGTVNSASVEPSLNTELANLNTAMAVNQLEKDVSDAVMADTTGADAGNLNVARENDVTDTEQGPTLMEEDVNMEECRQVENSKAFKNGDIHDKIMATPAISPKKCDDPRNSTSSSKKRGTNSLSKSSTLGRASKSPLHPSKRLASGQSRNDAVSTGNSNDKKKTMSNLLRISINFSSSSSKTNKTSVRMSRDSATPPKTPTRVLKEAADQENLAPSSEERQSSSTSKLSIHGGISKRATSRIGNKSNNHAYINKNPSLDSNEQRRITQKSVHMSMNFTPSAGEDPKTSPKISRESLTPLQTPTRASVNAGTKHASKDPPRDKRAISVNKSVSAAGEKRWPPISNLKSSNASGTSTRSSISLCPFSFRCEERAEKRKEFFKKLEDKMNSKEAEKSQKQITSKEKAKNVPNKIRQSIDVKAKLNEDSCYESQIHVKKIASSWPQSLKTGRKTFHSTAQNANSRSPRRPSINTESSKNGLMKNNKIPGTTLPKNRHENASPNIQLSVGKVGIPY